MFENRVLQILEDDNFDKKIFLQIFLIFYQNRISVDLFKIVMVDLKGLYMLQGLIHQGIKTNKIIPHPFTIYRGQSEEHMKAEIIV